MSVLKFNPPGNPELPVPEKRRWQPLRVGVVELFFYDVEEFWFVDGHLAIRGNNGTGKSKILALSLPFLFDANLSVHRVEPDGDPTKRMAWNLLMHGKYPRRTGYVWLEFGRVDEEGRQRFTTLACGLDAVEGRDSVESWFFIVDDDRVGADFSFISPDKTVFKKKALKEALADKSAHFFDRQEDYRRAVDQRLFRIGEERYRLLVDTLIQLRHPQLTKTPNTALLSKALTAALTPVPSDMIDSVADAMGRLEQDRSELRAFQTAQTAVGKFETVYRRYAGTRTKRFAREVSAARTRLDDASAAVNKSEADLASAIAREEMATAAFDAAQRERDAANETFNELNKHPDGLKANDLARKCEEAEKADALAAEAAEELEDAQADLAEERRLLDAAKVEADAAAQAFAAVRAKALSVAASVRLSGPFERSFIYDNGAATPAPAALAAEADQITAAISSRSETVDTILDLIDACDRLARQASEEANRASAALTRLEEARSRASLAERNLGEASERFVSAWRGHFSISPHVATPDFEDIAEGLYDWTQELTGDDPAKSTFRDACRRAQQKYTAEKAELDLRRRTQIEERAGIERRLHDLRSGTFQNPQPPHTRTADRSGRRGQAFWQSVDFKSKVDDAVRAGLEAALEASGLLDAWIMPDGRMFVGDVEHDVSLITRSPVGGKTLGAVLEHCGDAATADAVARILSSISCTAEDEGHEMWISPSGRFRIGALSGSWAKPQAVYIGHTARERARLALIAELTAASEALDAEIAKSDAAIAVATSAIKDIDRAESSIPSDRDLRAAHGEIRSTSAAVDIAQAEAARLELAADEAKRALDAKRSETETAAKDTQLPADRDGLRVMKRDCETLHRHHYEAVSVRRSLAHAEEKRLAQSRRVEVALSRRNEAEASSEEASSASYSAREVYAALKESVGDSVTQWGNRIDEARRRLSAANAAVNPANQACIAAASARATAESTHKAAVADLAQKTDDRQRAAEALHGVAASGLMTAGAPEVAFPSTDRPWTVEETRVLAATLNQALADIREADDPGTRVHAAFTELQTTLSPLGYTPHLRQIGEFGIVVAISDGRSDLSPAETLEKTGAEISIRSQLLTEGEAKILEDHLQSEISVAIRNLLREAEAYVERVNNEIKNRPTSTGTYFRLNWIPLDETQGAPPELAEARKRLLAVDADLWTDKDRQAIGAMLQRRIHEERIASEESGGSSLREQLAAALDYRKWHRFTVERNAMDKWTSIEAAASSGERALGLTVTMLAAVASFYGDENSTRPRVVMLDEAFAGIDDGVRRDVMGFISRFDLDFLITSEREWACYSTLPGVAICQLQRHDKVDAVHISRWRWTGNGRVDMEEPARLMLGRA